MSHRCQTPDDAPMTKLTVCVDGTHPISGSVSDDTVVTPFVGWLGLLRAVSMATGSALVGEPDGGGAGDGGARGDAELREDV